MRDERLRGAAAVRGGAKPARRRGAALHAFDNYDAATTID
jgi:hypothetical protein